MDKAEEKKLYMDDFDEESEEELIMLQETLKEYQLNPSQCRPWKEVYLELKNRNSPKP